VRRAVQDAINGDAQARAWLSKHLVGDDPIGFAELVEEVRRLAALQHMQDGSRP
jgi:hypothetical protein